MCVLRLTKQYGRGGCTQAKRDCGYPLGEGKEDCNSHNTLHFNTLMAMNTWASFYYHRECRWFCLSWASIAEDDSFEWLHRRISSRLKSWNHLVQQNKQHMKGSFEWSSHFRSIFNWTQDSIVSNTLQTITVPQESTTQKYYRISSIDPERRYLNFFSLLC